MVIQQQASSLSVLASFHEEKERIIEECVSQCVFVEHLNEWRAFLIEFVEVIGVRIFKNILRYFT